MDMVFQEVSLICLLFYQLSCLLTTAFQVAKSNRIETHLITNSSNAVVSILL